MQGVTQRHANGQGDWEPCTEASFPGLFAQATAGRIDRETFLSVYATQLTATYH